jgi:hypothetical protein
MLEQPAWGNPSDRGSGCSSMLAMQAVPQGLREPGLG